MHTAGVDPFFEQLKHGLALQKTNQRIQAQVVYRAILAQSPTHAMALHLAGTVAGQLGRPQEAVELIRKSLSVNPADPMAWNNLANALQDLEATEAALAAAGEALAIAPDYSSAWQTRATALLALSRQVEAIEAFEKVLQLTPHHPGALMGLWRASMECCKWTGLDLVRRQVESHLLAAENHALLPFESLSFTEDPAIHFRAAKVFGDAIIHRESFVPMQHVPRTSKRARIKVAYLSSDFHEHATAHLTAELFERHDRSRFEIVALSFGPDDGSPMRKRLQQAFDQFIDVRDAASDSVAAQIALMEVDILVDLKGYTRGARTSVLLRKPAPIVVNYLGYPGTMAQSAYDYVIGDPMVTPFAHSPYYTEKIVQMPHSYQVNDSSRVICERVSDRLAEGLPAEGFVFAAFNNCYKITPEFFDAWMRLLQRVPDSVLWLICEQVATRENLRRAAIERGVEPERLVFARRLPLAQHLARHTHAGVLLDTLPYNAHTTASDALWAGVPVVTYKGQTFAGRVAASLLTATGMPELIAYSLQEYEDLAWRLASDPQFLHKFKSRIADNRARLPLFDSARFASDLERAYVHMHERWVQGLAPQAFAVGDVS